MAPRAVWTLPDLTCLPLKKLLPLSIKQQLEGPWVALAHPHFEGVDWYWLEKSWPSATTILLCMFLFSDHRLPVATMTNLSASIPTIPPSKWIILDPPMPTTPNLNLQPYHHPSLCHHSFHKLHPHSCTHSYTPCFRPIILVTLASTFQLTPASPHTADTWRTISIHPNITVTNHIVWVFHALTIAT